MNVNNYNLSTVTHRNEVSHIPKIDEGQKSNAALSLTDSLKQTLGVKEGAEIDEEQFQHGLTKHILDDINPEAATEYMTAFKNARQSGASVEDAVKAALQELVQNGLLGREEAQKINGITFRAAQLDDNLTALYDGRGGPGDTTVAKAGLNEAVTKAEAVFNQIQSGELNVDARALDAPSNVAPTSSASGSHGIGGHSSVGGSGEFLWKPVSESNGKLVVLLPSKYTGQVVKAGIYSSLPPTSGNMIEEGKFAGDTHNGGRAHFRFGKSGGSYPDNSYVVAQLSNGETVSFKIGESSARNTK